MTTVCISQGVDVARLPTVVWTRAPQGGLGRHPCTQSDSGGTHFGNEIGRMAHVQQVGRREKLLCAAWRMFMFVCMCCCFTAHGKSGKVTAVHYYCLRELQIALPSLSHVAQITHSMQAVALPILKGYLWHG